jgi:hypothetical protein
MTKLERIALSAAGGGIWLLYCLIEHPAPPLPAELKWLVALPIAAWWSFTLWRWTANHAK